MLVAHYYVDPYIQVWHWQLAAVGDSLEMARFGQAHSADTLVVAGVRLWGSLQKFLVWKTVLMADLEAECSLDLGCPIEEFSAFCDAHPDRTVVVYANTSLRLKLVPTGWYIHWFGDSDICITGAKNNLGTRSSFR